MSDDEDGTLPNASNCSPRSCGSKTLTHTAGVVEERQTDKTKGKRKRAAAREKSKTRIPIQDSVSYASPLYSLHPLSIANASLFVAIVFTQIIYILPSFASPHLPEQTCFDTATSPLGRPAVSFRPPPLLSSFGPPYITLTSPLPASQAAHNRSSRHPTRNVDVESVIASYSLVNDRSRLEPR